MNKKTILLSLGGAALLCILLILGVLLANRNKGSFLPDLTIQGGEKNPNQNSGEKLLENQQNTSSLIIENVKDNTLNLKEIGAVEKDGTITFNLTGDLKGFFDKIDVAGLPVKNSFEVVNFKPGSDKFVLKINIDKSFFVDGKHPLVVQAIRGNTQDLKSKSIFLVLGE